MAEKNVEHKTDRILGSSQRSTERCLVQVKGFTGLDRVDYKLYIESAVQILGF